MIYLELFLSFLQIGLFSIGGGYAIMPMLKYEVVEKKGWLSLKEFIDILTISQSTPGPISINAATFVGVKVAGIIGGIISTLGAITPSIVIVLILAKLYTKYKNLGVIKKILWVLRPIVVALIASAAVVIVQLAFWGSDTNIILKNIDIFVFIIFLVSLFILRIFKINPIWIMLGSGLTGFIIFYLI